MKAIRKGGKERVPRINRKENQNSSLEHNGLENGALFRSLKGSLTVETAMVLPWFLFAMVTVLFLFRVLQLQYVVSESFDKAVAETVLMRETSTEEVENQVKLLFYQELATQNCPISMIDLGLAGFSWNDSEVNESYIDMEVTYKVKMPGWILKDKKLEVRECNRCRRWIGMSGAGESGANGEWVYVTPGGSVYHRSRDCTHLKLSVHSATAEEAKNYRPCELCAAERAMPSVVYITEEGECYHTKLNCSGLKRTVYMIPLSQAEGRSPCSRCGGR